MSRAWRRVPPSPSPARSDPSACPACGAPDALYLFRTVECPREACRLYTVAAGERALRLRLERVEAARRRFWADQALRDVSPGE